MMICNERWKKLGFGLGFILLWLWGAPLFAGGDIMPGEWQARWDEAKSDYKKMTGRKHKPQKKWSWFRSAGLDKTLKNLDKIYNYNAELLTQEDFLELSRKLKFDDFKSGINDFSKNKRAYINKGLKPAIKTEQKKASKAKDSNTEKKLKKIVAALEFLESELEAIEASLHDTLENQMKQEEFKKGMLNYHSLSDAEKEALGQIMQKKCYRPANGAKTTLLSSLKKLEAEPTLQQIEKTNIAERIRDVHLSMQGCQLYAKDYINSGHSDYKKFGSELKDKSEELSEKYKSLEKAAREFITKLKDDEQRPGNNEADKVDNFRKIIFGQTTDLPDFLAWIKKEKEQLGED